MVRGPRVHLLTFAAGAEFANALHAIRKEAEQIPCIDEIHAHSEHTIVSDPVFWDRHAEFVTSRPRGWGYWLWKPYLNIQLLNQIDDDDVVIYVDAGCQLNACDTAVARLQEYIQLARDSEHGILSFELRRFFEHQYTKTDTAVALNAMDHMASKQLVGGIFVYRKCPHVLQLFQACYSACCSHNYRLIDDSASDEPNDPGFREHRHDQSVFSLLRKKMGTATIVDESYWGPDWESRGRDYPIWARRRR
jgi:hypothetical protein